MKKILASVLVGYCFISLSAQENKPCFCDSIVAGTFEPNLTGEIYYPLPGLLGSEFFNLDHLNGDIILSNGDTVANKRLRYNGRIDGLLLWPKQSSREILLDRYFIKTFILKNFLGQHEITFEKIKTKKEFSTDSTEIFAQLLYRNKLSLYAFRRYIFKEDVISVIDGRRISRKSFGPSNYYYFLLPNHRTVGFKSFRKKNLFNLFPEKKEQIKQLFKEKHQHRFRKEQDLIRISEILSKIPL